MPSHSCSHCSATTSIGCSDRLRGSSLVASLGCTSTCPPREETLQALSCLWRLELCGSYSRTRQIPKESTMIFVVVHRRTKIPPTPRHRHSALTTFVDRQG